MHIVVQKFGGTSLASAEKRERVIDHVQRAREDGLSPVMVVSAMGRKGDPYATDTFISLAEKIHPDTAPRELDLLTSCGEIISAVVMANTLRQVGLESVVLTGGQAGIVTDNNFNDARIIRVDPERVRSYLEQGLVVIVAGYQGRSESGEVTTLGRGGSDTTACALGAALDAQAIEIYTDVSGIKTADPSFVPEARTLTSMTYEEISQLAHEGAKVIHPRAVEIAMRASIPLRIRSTFDDEPGTLVAHNGAQDSRWPGVTDQLITGVTYLEDMTQIVVKDDQQGRRDLQLFRTLAEENISVDMINVAPDRKAFIVQARHGDRAGQLLRDQGFELTKRTGVAKVSVVGMAMRGVPGVMANVVEALDTAGVTILQTVDSHVNIACLVDASQLKPAVQALHKQFGLEQG